MFAICCPGQYNCRNAGARSNAGAVRTRLWLEPLEDRTLLSNAIVVENQMTGTLQTTWDVTDHGDSRTEGFATDISVNHGDTVYFKVNDKDIDPYHLDIYRMGYYQGNSARYVTTVYPDSGVVTSPPNPNSDTPTGLVAAGHCPMTAH